MNNPLKDDTIRIEVEIICKTNFAGCLAQIMIHPWSEHGKMFRLDQYGMVNMCLSHEVQTFKKTVDIDISGWSLKQRSTMKLYAYWGLDYGF